LTKREILITLPSFEKDLVITLDSKKKCAYCDATENFTKEHIFPASIIKTYTTEMRSINDKIDHDFQGDLVIGDVCATCNNGALSKLDASFIKTFKSQMAEPLNPGDEVVFEFDYDLLLRELLKISYNSARASKNGYDAKVILEKHVPYILTGSGKISGTIVSLQIVTSANATIQETGESLGMMKPYLLRSASVEGLNLNPKNYITRMVAFNSFWFYLLIPKWSVTSAIKNDFWKEFKSKTHLHGVLLKKGVESIKITKDKTTYLHIDLIEKMRRKTKR